MERRHILGLVQDEDSVFPFDEELDQELVQLIDQLLLRRPRASEAEVLKDGPEELLLGEDGVEDEGGLRPLVELPEQSVVFPVPTSPVMAMNPSRCWMP